MNNALNKAQQLLFILLGISIPTSIAATNIIIACLALCWILEGQFTRKIKYIRESKWILAILGLMLLYGLGMLWGDNHLNANWQFQRLALLLVFPVLATINLSQKTIKNAVMAFLATNFVSAILAIAINNNIIQDLDNYLPFIESTWRISAFISYNYHNVLLAFATAISLYILAEKKTKYPYLFILFIIGYTLSIFTEIGRAGVVIFNFIFFAYIMFYFRKKWIKLAGLFLLLFAFQYLMYNTSEAYKSRLDRGSKIVTNNGIKEGKEDIRYVFIRESFNKIKEKPILGYGTGSFGTIFERDIKTVHKFYTHTTPHNNYLYVWFELGILGLLLLLAIFYYQLRELFAKKDGAHRILAPLSFMFLMAVDSYFFIFILTIFYIFIYTIYSRYQEE